EAPLLFRSAGDQEGRRRPADSDPPGTLHAGPVQLVVDDQLGNTAGAGAPGGRPLRHNVAGRGELPPGRTGVGVEPGSHRQPAGIVVGREVEVHRQASGSSAAGMSTTRARSHSPRLLAWASWRGDAATPSCSRPWITKVRQSTARDAW